MNLVEAFYTDFLLSFYALDVAVFQLCLLKICLPVHFIRAHRLPTVQNDPLKHPMRNGAQVQAEIRASIYLRGLDFWRKCSRYNAAALLELDL